VRALITVLVAILLGACGSTPSASRAASATASTRVSVAAGAKSGPISLVVETTAPTANVAGTITLLSTDGRDINKLVVPPGAMVLAAAGSRVFIRASDGTLQALHRDGTIERLNIGPYRLTGIGGLVPNPAGTQWVWASQNADSSSQALYAGGSGSARLLATLPYPLVLEAYAWTPKGVVLDSLPMDFSGYRPFNTTFGAGGGVRELDVATGTVRPLATPSQCIFSDSAPNGSIACFPTPSGYLVPNQHALRIVDPGGKTTDLSLALPRFTYVGDAFFSPDGSTLTVAGATGSGLISTDAGPPSANPSLEQYGTDLVKVADGSIVRFGPSGVRPAMGRQSWLPDGRLVLWRPNATGGSPGLYVMAPYTTAPGAEIETSGTPIGFLTG
jgi:hypothetical protein